MGRVALELADALDGQQAPLVDHGDPVGDVLELREHVRAEEDREPVCAGLAHELVEGLLEDRVQPARRLVEHHELGPVLEGLHDPDLLLVALRELPGRAVERQVEAAGQRPGGGEVAHALEAAEERERLARGEPLVQPQLPREVADPAAQLHASGAGVEAEHRGRPRGRAQQVEQRADQRGLAGAVGPDEPEGLSGIDLEVEPVQGDDPAPVDLREALGSDDGVHAPAR